MIEPHASFESDPRRILIVEAEPETRELLRVGLASCGLLIQTAKDGAEALSHLESGEFDLVLLDLRIPDMDGLELIETLRTQRNFTRIIVTSPYIPKTVVLTAISLGVTKFMDQPTNLRLFRNLVKEVLQGEETPERRAFRFARKLNFAEAARTLEYHPKPDPEIVIWKRVFDRLAFGRSDQDLSEFSNDIMEYAIARN